MKCFISYTYMVLNKHLFGAVSSYAHSTYRMNALPFPSFTPASVSAG